jgi:hypothetical protein
MVAEVESLRVFCKVSYNFAVNVGSSVIVVNEVIFYLFHTNCAVIPNLVEICFPDDNRVISVAAVLRVEMFYVLSALW